MADNFNTKDKDGATVVIAAKELSDSSKSGKVSLLDGTTSTTPISPAVSQVEDAAHVSGDKGVAILGVRRDTAASGAGTDGDYATINLNATGHVYVAAGATENHVGEVGGPGDLIDVTLSLDTSAYADGDVMADTQTVSNAVRVNGGRAILQSIQVLDEDDIGQTMDIIFLSANNSLGTENAAPSISDANARDILGRVRIDTADFIDLGGCKICTKLNIGLILEAAGGSTSLFVGTIIRGAGTYTASGVRLKLGLLWD